MQIDSQELKRFQKVAESIARGAGEILLNYRGKAKITKSKAHELDIVTEADEASEKYILTELKKNFPGHGILSEESGKHKENSHFRWVVDPLDGTLYFKRRISYLAVNLALEYQGEIVIGVTYFPLRNDLYSAAKDQGVFINGIKIYVSNVQILSRSIVVGHPLAPNWDEKEKNKIWQTYEQIAQQAYRLFVIWEDAGTLCNIASGGFEGMYRPILKGKWWDVAAGILMVQEAGGMVTDVKGRQIKKATVPEGFVASNGKIHDCLLKIIRGRF